MRACKNWIRTKKRSKEELRTRVMYLQEEVVRLEEIVYELQHRVTQLEIMRKLGN